MGKVRITPGFLTVLTLYILTECAGLFWCVLPGVLLHELGHWVFIRLHGGYVESLTLGACGFRLDYRGCFRRGQELQIALAGAAYNLLAALFCAVLWRRGITGGLQAAGVNLLLAGVNLIPAEGLDGGTALLLLLRAFLPRNRADRVFFWISRIFSLGILIFGLYIALKTRYNISVFCLGLGLSARMILSVKSDKRVYKWIV